MTVRAKSIVADKFWIVEEDGIKIGTIQSSHLGITFLKKDATKERFSSIKLLSDKYNVVFETEDSTKKEKSETQDYFIYDYPCKTQPFNAGFNVTKNLPLYTKKENSVSYYCAGWYLIKFTYGWSKALNPKLISLQRNEYLGPYKTKLEMLQIYKQVSKDDQRSV